MLEKVPKPLQNGLGLSEVGGGLTPVLVRGNSLQGEHVKGLIGAADEQLDLFRPEERQSVPAADSVEATFEGLELACDLRVQQILDIHVNEFAAVSIRDGAVSAVGAKCDLSDLAIPLDVSYEVSAENIFDRPIEIEKLSEATSEGGAELCEVIQVESDGRTDGG